MGAIPFFHVYGMTVAMSLSIYCGGTLLIVPTLARSTVMKAIHNEKGLRPLAGRWPKGHQNVQTEVLEVAIAEAAPIEQLDFEIDAFGKTVAVPTIEVVQDALPPIVERPDEGLQGTQAGGFGLNLPFGSPLAADLRSADLANQVRKSSFNS